MSDYSKSTNFTTKDTLPTGNSGKIVKGTELDTEFTAISSAIASKADISSPALLGTPTTPTATAGSNTTQIASTAFVKAAVDTATGSLGTMSTQNKTAVDITGGTIVGITDLAVADGGTGSSTLSANAVLLGNGTSALQTVAPSTTGNVLTSNGTTWTSSAISIKGLGYGGETWASKSVTSGTSYTNNKSYPIMVNFWAGPNPSPSSGSLSMTVDGVQVSYQVGNFNGSGMYLNASAIVPPGKTYSATKNTLNDLYCATLE
jgi:hypothetical protein